ncbi:ras-like protein [Anaeramoeba ignava]|uniref:small monomeric GTPase n=1 Tax=Anaeramoeba ignava TaxID=1746090 RepID=A0A9Q0LXJ1_ANAIG|nr:ras-like protein [Anaeramoeba ignava]|eukprot:Anaeramoba_ignava/c19769_g4_i1.p1 GENE.c19769_g4_i1~~c19769_g4_i1.p1  ORF type:complete len:199 (-),score=62.40 c19769_g4_i1:60-656(-)
MEDEEVHKVVIIGGGSVGKSCITVRFLQGKFIEDYDPTIEESYKKVVIIDEKPATLEIIDTAGQEEYRSVRDKYIRLGEGFILVFSIISRASYTEARGLHEAIRRAKNFMNVPVVTVANKSDLAEERLVSTEEGETLAKKYSSPYYETSAKTGSNVNICFEALVRELRKAKSSPKTTGQNSAPQANTETKSGGCCLIL